MIKDAQTFPAMVEFIAAIRRHPATMAGLVVYVHRRQDMRPRGPVTQVRIDREKTIPCLWQVARFSFQNLPFRGKMLFVEIDGRGADGILENDPAVNRRLEAAGLRHHYLVNEQVRAAPRRCLDDALRLIAPELDLSVK